MVREKLPEQVKKQRLSGSVVLAGAGALLPGIAELASREFKTENVRIAQPGNYGGQVEAYRSPEFSTVIGLLVANMDKADSADSEISVRSGTRKTAASSLFQGIGDWFREFF